MNKSGTRTSFLLSGNCADSLLSTAVGTFEGRGGHGLLDRYGWGRSGPAWLKQRLRCCLPFEGRQGACVSLCCYL